MLNIVNVLKTNRCDERDLYLVGPVEHACIKLGSEVHPEHSLCKLLVQHCIKQKVILHERKPTLLKFKSKHHLTMLTLFIIGNLRKPCQKINSNNTKYAFEGRYKKFDECMICIAYTLLT